MSILTNSQRTANTMLNECARLAEQHFVETFGTSPRWLVAAPGRVNLIGEHTDYNDGYVLPMAIDRYVVIAANLDSEAEGENNDNTAVFRSANLGVSFSVALDKVTKSDPGDWTNYVRGVLAGFLSRGYTLPSFNAVIQSSVPLGGGLSSSAALEVSVATLLEALLETKIDPKEKALLCQQAEHQFAGVPCGIMDQFCSIFGQEDSLLLIDCSTKNIEPIDFTSPDVTVLIANSNVDHELAAGEYSERRLQCESAVASLGVTSLRNATLEGLEKASAELGETICRRARHVISENTRTLQAAEAIREENWITTGQLMFASHDSLRNDYEVSCRELDLLVDIAREIGIEGGVYGSRMTGGGFGGCTVSLVRTDSLASVKETLQTRYHQSTGIEPCLFATRPARGAHVIRG